MTPTILAELDRARVALPPIGVRARLDAVAFNADLDPATFTRRLAVLCAAGEARLKDGWVRREWSWRGVLVTIAAGRYPVSWGRGRRTSPPSSGTMGLNG